MPESGVTAGTPAMRPTRVRHVVLWLTVLAYLITYMDRVVISTAAPSIQKEFGFSNETLGWIFGAFPIAYAVFQIPGGWLGDRFGPRRALTGVVMWWSAFTALTATDLVGRIDDGHAASCSAWARPAPFRSRPARCRAGCCRPSAAGLRA